MSHERYEVINTDEIERIAAMACNIMRVRGVKFGKAITQAMSSRLPRGVKNLQRKMLRPVIEVEAARIFSEQTGIVAHAADLIYTGHCVEHLQSPDWHEGLPSKKRRRNALEASGVKSAKLQGLLMNMLDAELYARVQKFIDVLNDSAAHQARLDPMGIMSGLVA